MPTRLRIMEMLISNFVRATAYCGKFFVRFLSPFMEIMKLFPDVDHNRFHPFSLHVTHSPTYFDCTYSLN